MVIPYYAYLVLKMSGPRGVISIRGDIKWAFDYDRESCETVDRFTASIELQDLKQALAESSPNLVIPEAKTLLLAKTHRRELTGNTRAGRPEASIRRPCNSHAA
jgi:hypothetical protein